MLPKKNSKKNKGSESNKNKRKKETQEIDFEDE